MCVEGQVDGEIEHAILSTKAGRVDAFEEVVRRCDPELRAYLACRCTSAEEVEELTQEAFVLAFQKLADYDPSRGAFIAWLKGFARNLVLQRIETKARRAAGGPVLRQILASRASERASADPDLHSALRHCLGRLPADSRRLLDLRYEAGLRSRELGERLGRKVTTRLQRVRDALRGCMQAFLAEKG